MASLNFQQQRLEADFRHHLMRVREYSEAIALDRGAGVERSSLQTRFAQVIDNFMRLLRVQKRYTWFSSGYGQAAVVFPMLVASPRYFSGAIQLGELMQISSAFGQVQESLSWFITNYSRLASWQATTLRLTSFQDQMQAIETERTTQTIDAQENLPAIDSNISDLGTPGLKQFTTPLLTISLPNDVVLLDHVSFQVKAGDRVLIRGPSGCGKSTLLRVFAGIWPYVHPNLHIALPEGTVFMPQRPYFPQGKLRDALTYPQTHAQHSDAVLQQALINVHLPHLIEKLEEEGHWTQQLSGGEQQRLSMARVFLKQARWVFADEATSALDEALEQAMYEKLLAMVSTNNGALVSVAHRPNVAAFHNQQWVFEVAPADSAAKYALTFSASSATNP
jgi:putative ATP-binding cassette transporter